MSNQAIPADFPRDTPLASVPRTQPKLAVRLVDGRYITGHTDEEWLERYQDCEGLAQQFTACCTRSHQLALHTSYQCRGRVAHRPAPDTLSLYGYRSKAPLIGR